MSKQKQHNIIRIVLGNILLALAVNVLIRPAGIIAGGSTGLALVISQYTSLSFSLITTIISVSTFVLGYVVLGKEFALTTLLSTMIYPVIITLTNDIPLYFTLTNDTFIQIVLAGVMCGVALGMIFQSGASSGGMDIPPLALQKLFHINVTVSMYVMDILILLAQCPSSSISDIVYGLIYLVVVYLTMDRVLTTGKSSIQIMVYTEKYYAVRDMLLHKMDKGVTMYEIETGYLENEQMAVCTICARKDLPAIKDAIYHIDPSAFMTVSNVQEVRGYRFRPFTQSELEHFIKK